MDMGGKSRPMGNNTVLLLITSMLVSAIYTAAALSSTDAPPSPADAPSTPSTQTDPETNRFLAYKEASPDVVGDYSSVVWTELNPSNHKTCDVTGYYDATVLNTTSSVKLCFVALRSIIVTSYAEGAVFFTEQFYYNGIDDPTESCVVNCLVTSAASSIQMRFVSLFFALSAFLASYCF